MLLTKKKMDTFSQFCNICYKTDNVILRNIYNENKEHLTDILITFIGYADVINKNAIYLCPMCYQELIRFNKFREMCYSNLIQLRQMYFNIKSKLELEENAITVTNILKEFLHAEVLRHNSIRESNSTDPISTDLPEILKESTYSFKKKTICKKQIINLHSERNQHEFGENVNLGLNENEPGGNFNFDDSGINSSNGGDTSHIEFKKEELLTKFETENILSENFDLKCVGSETTENLKFDFDDPSINNSNACSTSQIQFTKDGLHENSEMQNKTSENIKLKRVQDRPDECYEIDVSDISTAQMQFIKELHSEMDIENSTSDYIEIKKFNSESGEDGKSDFDVVIISDSEGSDYNLEIDSTQELPLKIRKSTSITKKVETGPRSEGVTVRRESQSGSCTDKWGTGAVNIQQHSLQVREHCKRRRPTTMQSAPHEQVPSGAESNKCAICNKMFADKSSFIKHACIYNRARPYECNVCHKAFIRSSHLIAHRRIHSGIKPFKCTVCNKSFSQSHHLTIHERIHSGDRPYKCKVCNMAFTRSDNLVIHERVHTGAKPFKCTICNKSFRAASSLTTHIRSHNNARPHKCSVCNKSFSTSSYLRVHQSSHSETSPYECTVCNQAFARLLNLTRHESTHVDLF